MNILILISAAKAGQFLDAPEIDQASKESNIAVGERRDNKYDVDSRCLVVVAPLPPIIDEKQLPDRRCVGRLASALVLHTRRHRAAVLERGR